MIEGEIVESRFQVVFRGELLDGVLPDVAKRLAAERFNASPTQIERIFNGRSVTLKAGLDSKMAARYGAELRRIGLRVVLEAESSVPPDASFRIVYAGQTLDGFEREAVMQAAAKRLHASAPQLKLMFSGQKAVLKKGLDERTARSYAARLREIGMHVAIDRDNKQKTPTATPPVQTPSVPAATPEAPTTRRIDPVATQIYRPNALLATEIHRPVSVPPEPVRSEPVPISHLETLVHTPLQAATALLDAATTQVDFDFTQTMMDRELAITQPHDHPDLEGTMISSPVSLLQHLPDNAALARVAPPEPPPAPPTPLMPALSAPPMSVDPTPTQTEFKLRVTQVCAGCGARQAYGRYCAHCGYEFPTAPKILLDPGLQATPAETAADSLKNGLASQQSSSEPPQAPRRSRLLLATAMLLALCGGGWFLLHLPR